MTDYLSSTPPEISRLVMITFLGEVETEIRSGITSRFGIMGL